MKNIKNSILLFLAKRLPTYCPFERDVIIFGYELFHIPSLCKINPWYEEIVEIQLKLLGYDNGNN